MRWEQPFFWFGFTCFFPVVASVLGVAPAPAYHPTWTCQAVSRACRRLVRSVCVLVEEESAFGLAVGFRGMQGD